MQIDEARAKHAVQQAFQKIVKPADFDAAIVEEFGRQASAERECCQQTYKVILSESESDFWKERLFRALLNDPISVQAMAAHFCRTSEMASHDDLLKFWLGKTEATGWNELWRLNVVEKLRLIAEVLHGADTPPRRGVGRLPYIVHPQAVVRQLKEWGYTEADDPVVLALGWGHDLFEDTRLGKEPELLMSFAGEDRNQMEAVVAGIRTLSFFPAKGISDDEYKCRKRAYISAVAKNAPASVLVVKMADRLCNTRDFLAGGDPHAKMYLDDGKCLFERLSETKHPQLVETALAEVRFDADKFFDEWIGRPFN